MSQKKDNAYWKENLKYLGTLLGFWFLFSFVFGILLVDQLNNYCIGGFKLGFWFAQQGSIYAFIAIIAIYIKWMNKLDHKYGMDKDDDLQDEYDDQINEINN